jgi:hypothetical protein
VVVTGKSDKPALNLQQQDFTLLDNKDPQKIVSFQAVDGAAANPPVEIILLIDRVNTSFEGVANVLLQTKKFLGQNGGQLAQPVSLISFTDTGTSVGNASRDGNALITLLDQTEASLRTTRRSQGFYGIAFSCRSGRWDRWPHTRPRSQAEKCSSGSVRAGHCYPDRASN